MSALDGALAALLAERDTLADRLQLLDEAICALRAIVDADPAPAAAPKPAASSAGARQRRYGGTRRSDADKQRIIDCAHRVAAAGGSWSSQAIAVAKEFNITPNAAKQAIYKARQAGFTPSLLSDGPSDPIGHLPVNHEQSRLRAAEAI